MRLASFPCGSFALTLHYVPAPYDGNAAHKRRPPPSGTAAFREGPLRDWGSLRAPRPAQHDDELACKR